MTFYSKEDVPEEFIARTQQCIVEIFNVLEPINKKFTHTVFLEALIANFPAFVALAKFDNPGDDHDVKIAMDHYSEILLKSVDIINQNVKKLCP